MEYFSYFSEINIKDGCADILAFQTSIVTMESIKFLSNSIDGRAKEFVPGNRFVPMRTEISLPADSFKVRNDRVTRRPSQQVAEISTNIDIPSFCYALPSR